MTERELELGSEVRWTRCAECGRNAKRIITRVGVVIPTYMKAEADDVKSIQDRYLKSDKHRKTREQTERIQDRNRATEQSFESFKAKLPENIR